MSASTSLYRKYRSQSFEELVGQEPVVRTLKNAISSGRIAHAYLFTGPRGVGKTSAARLLARAANCLSDTLDKPCNQCANCLAVANDLVTDLIEIDAASNTGVDNIREIIERANFAPSVWQTKFYIVDEVHMLSVSAFNALLKTLEEPPPQTAFILATTEVHKVPATVASRCQRFDFRKIPLQAMLDRLQYICDSEGIEADRKALELVARQSTGSLRDAESLLDQLRVFAEGRITLAAVQDMLGASGAEQVADFADTLVGGNLAAGLKLINRVLDEGLDPRQLNRQIVEHLRGLMLIKSGATAGDPLLLDATEEMRKRMTAQAAQVEMPDLLRWTKAFAEADAAIRSSAYRQLPLEMALVTASMPAEVPALHAAQTVRDRSAEAVAGADRIGAMQATDEARASRPAQAPRQAASYTQAPVAPAPPPIQRELGTLNQNGSKQTTSPEPGSAAAPTPGTQSALPAARPPDYVADVQAQSFSESPPEAPAPSPAGDKVENAGESAPASPDELQKLQKMWPTLVDQIMARAKPIGMAFSDPNLVRPFRVVGENVTISFRWPIQATRSQDTKQRAIIEEALGRVLGHKCILGSILFSEEEHGGPSTDSFLDQEQSQKQPKQKKVSPYETTRGKAAMNIFGITRFDD